VVTLTFFTPVLAGKGIAVPGPTLTSHTASEQAEMLVPSAAVGGGVRRGDVVPDTVVPDTAVPETAESHPPSSAAAAIMAIPQRRTGSSPGPKMQR
jgi:hypothetical protein